MHSLNVFYKQEHSDQPFVVHTVEDVDALVDALLQEPLEEHSIAALYVRERPALPSGFPDHELRVAVNAETKVGGLRYTGTDGTNDGTWYAAGAQSERDEVWYCYMGHDEDFPQDSEVGIEQVRAAVKEFLLSGGTRPESLEWTSTSEDVA